MKLKSLFIGMIVVQAGFMSAQKYGINAQYFPGLQFGAVKVSTNHPKLGNYSYSAGLPILMIDRVARWYFNLDLNATYYAATQTNKATDNKVKISKAEGGYISGRIGYMFGKNPDKLRIGINFNYGLMTSNLDSIRKPFDQRGYTGLGGGLVFYQAIGKLGVMAKAGYEKYANKKFIDKASGFYIEGTIAYKIIQKFGVSVMPCFYSKNFDYKAQIDGALTQAKVSSFVLRVGITKFL